MSYQKNYPNGWQSGEAGGTPITPETMNNIESGIANSLPKDGTDPMAADLPMGGHRVTELGEPVENGDAVPLRYVNQNFAPAGYGLGGDSKYVSDVNQAIANGWYYSNPNTLNIPEGMTGYADIFVKTRTDAVAQYIRNVMNNTNLVRYKEDANSDWIVEWENPPMESGIEYRTTERFFYNGVYFPVYTMEIYCGHLPPSGYQVYPFPDAVNNALVITDWSGYIDYWGVSLPSGDPGFNVYPAKGNGGVVMKTDTDRSANGGVFITLKYIKAT